ncbi:hypothetical protein QYE76_011156 [Lolium multiflorum]|uniref:Uncharacterized protein n=1 Tax=Lolium multiflorum TaxID=4521 RepID=A0AAD8X5C9_LOLMU|nr:hypothetical protein QYE76_011156 [Lolium multiflorum]
MNRARRFHTGTISCPRPGPRLSGGRSGGEAVRGLWLCADFLPSDDQLRLLAVIQRGWMNEDEDGCPLPSDLLWRELLFDELIAIRYKPGEVWPRLEEIEEHICTKTVVQVCAVKYRRGGRGGRCGVASGHQALQPNPESVTLSMYLD